MVDKKLLIELREAFAIFDTNNDGVISAEELNSMMRNLKKDCTLEKAEEMIKQVDKSGSGSIDFSEFVELMIKSFEDIGKDIRNMRAIFNYYDNDGDGFLSRNEFRETAAVLNPKLTNDTIEKIFHVADLDKNGFIDFEEFWKTIDLPTPDFE